MATPDFVVQVSDRVLTHFQGSKIIGFVRTANKSVLHGNAISFGYTGIAQIEGMDSDLYFAKRLAEIKGPCLGTRLQHVARSLTNTFLKAGYAKQVRRHAYVGVGWGSFQNDVRQLYSALFRIANFDLPKGLADPLPEARDDFRIDCTVNKPPRKMEWPWLANGVACRNTRLIFSVDGLDSGEERCWSAVCRATVRKYNPNGFAAYRNGWKGRTNYRNSYQRSTAGRGASFDEFRMHSRPEHAFQSRQNVISFSARGRQGI